MIIATFEKQPADVQDYDIDFNPYLSVVGDTINSIEVDVPSDIESPTAPSHDSGIVKFWAEGGTTLTKHKVTIRIYTNHGRVLEHEVIITVFEY